MSKMLISTLLLCLFSPLFAQIATLKSSNDFYTSEYWNHECSYLGKSPDGNYLFKIEELLTFGSSGSFFEQAKVENTRIVVQKYNKGLKKVMEKSIETKDLMKEHESITIYKTLNSGDSLYFVYITTNKKEKTKNILVMSLDKQNLTFSSPRKLLGLTDVNIDSNFSSDCEIKVSPDSSKILISYNRGNYPTRLRTFYLQAWTFGFNSLLWSKEVTTTSEKNGEYASRYIDNSANAYIIFDDIEKNRNNVKYQLLRITQLGEEMVYNELDFGEYTRLGFMPKFDDKTNLTAFSYFDQNDILSGLYMFDFPISSQKSTAVRFHKFEQKIDEGRKTDASYKRRTKFDITRVRYMPRKVVFSTNGDITIVSEEFNRTVWIANSLYYYEYYFDDIIVMRINKEGNVLWKKRIPKRQASRSMGDDYQVCSLKAVEDGDDIQLFYIENADNDPNSTKIKPFSMPITEKEKPTLVMTTINAKGETKKDILYTFGKDDLIPMVSTMDMIDTNEAILCVSKKWSYTLGKISW